MRTSEYSLGLGDPDVEICVIPSGSHELSSEDRQCTPEDLVQISKDVSRTRFYDLQELGPTCSERVQEVLQHYAAKDPEVGYCQGMNFVASVLAVKCETVAEASSHFDALLQHFRNLWVPGFPLLAQGSEAFEVVFKDQVPEVHSHFQVSGLTSDMFLADTWLTVFARWLPLYLLWPVYQCLECHGIVGLISGTIALLQAHSKTLTAVDDFGALFVFLKELAKEPQPELDDLLRSIEELVPVAQSAWSHIQPSQKTMSRCSSHVRSGNRVLHMHTGDELVFHGGWNSMVAAISRTRQTAIKHLRLNHSGSENGMSPGSTTSTQRVSTGRSWSGKCQETVLALLGCPRRSGSAACASK
mmetsp:Transcript_64577/g.120226  ORF Transcript_64577/g.120226 Transcript_64577/m.120226 type:complete len:357 (-) Transcript_64577:153-1223(-)